jgi:hypothetical protein
LHRSPLAVPHGLEPAELHEWLERTYIAQYIDPETHPALLEALAPRRGQTPT